MPKTTKIHWLNWLGMVPTSEIKEIRQRIIDECHITPGNFYHWRNRLHAVPPLSQEKIQAIAGSGYELDFTFEPRIIKDAQGNKIAG